MEDLKCEAANLWCNVFLTVIRSDDSTPQDASKAANKAVKDFKKSIEALES